MDESITAYQQPRPFDNENEHPVPVPDIFDTEFHSTANENDCNPETIHEVHRAGEMTQPGPAVLGLPELRWQIWNYLLAKEPSRHAMVEIEGRNIVTWRGFPRLTAAQTCRRFRHELMNVRTQIATPVFNAGAAIHPNPNRPLWKHTIDGQFCWFHRQAASHHVAKKLHCFELLAGFAAVRFWTESRYEYNTHVFEGIFRFERARGTVTFEGPFYYDCAGKFRYLGKEMANGILRQLRHAICQQRDHILEMLSRAFQELRRIDSNEGCFEQSILSLFERFEDWHFDWRMRLPDDRALRQKAREVGYAVAASDPFDATYSPRKRRRRVGGRCSSSANSRKRR